MLEFFLFINPIGSHCLKAEEAMLRVADESEEHLHFRFVPMLNLQIITEYMESQQLDTRDLDLRNRIFHTTYEAVLDYKAADFQGNLKGRRYLMTLQTALNRFDQEYSTDLVEQLLVDAKIDKAMFYEDRQSLAKRAFDADQQIASEMQIKTAPSAVVFDYSKPETETGILIDEKLSYSLLKNVSLGKYTSPYGLLTKHTEQPIEPAKRNQIRIL